MIRLKDLRNERNNHYIGQIIRVPKARSSERIENVNARIVGMYPKFVLLEDEIQPRYRWSLKWIDLILLGGQV